MREFDGGWVAWTVTPPGDAGVLPDRIGDARVVVDGVSGELTSWPPLPVDEIIARSRRAPLGRFPEDVEAELRKAGWYPGRTVPAADLDRYAERLRALTADDPPPVEVADSARSFLSEFGGLTIERTPEDVWSIQPQDHSPVFDLFAYLEELLDQIVTPIGWVAAHYDTELVMSADGRVWLADFSNIYLLAEGGDWALVRLARGDRSVLPSIREDGEIHYTDYAGRPIDPGSTRGPGSSA
ncbi:SUKH-3 domain-containing protein [Cryptosporangium aurantiacum]|uniref:SUKH-3 domain-containing protein n=1 Tax=Cryptosporangium aurantiacum TaxID=134849 RepID=UPI0015BAC82E|nr:SUKH-3 domain-containing protein [Cryptosporangium aurantiacum]